MRKLYAKVTDREIKLQSAFAGVQGEAGASALVLSFSADWLSLGKRLIFYNAHHENPVTVLLGVDRLYGDDPFTYLVPVPGEALEFSGDMLILIEGTCAGTGALVRTLATVLRVHPAPTGESAPGIGDEALQLQAEIDAISKTLLEGMADAEEIGGYARRAEAAAEQAEAHAGVALAASRNCLLATGDRHAACFHGVLTVPTEGEEAEDGFVCSVAVREALSTDALFMFVPREKRQIAEQMGLWACESCDGSIRLYAHKAPRESFSMEYTLLRGVILL